MWKEVQDASEIVHSVSELFGDNTSQRKKSKLVKHKIINEDDWEDNSTTPSPVHNKIQSRTSDYDKKETQKSVHPVWMIIYHWLVFHLNHHSS